MLRARSQGSTELNEVRETIGLRPAGPAAGWTTRDDAVPGVSVPCPDVMRWRGYAVDQLSRGMRQLVGALTVISGGVAMTHQVLEGALAHDWGPWGAAATLLAWPVPQIQPILAGIGALVLFAVGVTTGGWRDIGPTQDWLLLAGAIAALLGAGPMLLVCALTAVAFVVLAIIGFVILFYLIRLMLQ
jgi:hypothetical protein